MSTTVTVEAWETSADFQVELWDDDVREGDESFTLVLSDPLGAVLGEPVTAVVTLFDNEPLPSVALALDSLGMREGDTQFLLTALLSHRSSQPMTVGSPRCGAAASSGRT